MPISAVERLQNFRNQRNAPKPPPLPENRKQQQAPPPAPASDAGSEVDYEELGNPIQLTYATSKKAGKGGGAGSIVTWLLFTLVPMIVVAVGLYFSKLFVTADGKPDWTKIILAAAVAGIVGAVIKFFLFSS